MTDHEDPEALARKQRADDGDGGVSDDLLVQSSPTAHPRREVGSSLSFTEVEGVQVGSDNLQVNFHFYGNPSPFTDADAVPMPRRAWFRVRNRIRARAGTEGAKGSDRNLASALPPTGRGRPPLELSRAALPMSLEGSARYEFRELRAEQKRAADSMNQPQSVAGAHANTDLVLCPICLEQFSWNQVRQALYVQAQGVYAQASRQVGESDQHWRQRTASAFIRCPSGHRQGEHYLPASYGAYGDPIIIAAIGAKNSGKSTLLTMLGAELERNPMLRGELSFQPLNHVIAQHFHENYARPLREERICLPATAPEPYQMSNFFHAWRGYNHCTGRPFTLAFFDVSGEDLVSFGGLDVDARLPPFIAAASAFLFLADADVLADGDPTHGKIINWLLGSAKGPYLDVPAATILVKSDLLSDQPEVLRWLSRDDDCDLSSIIRESEDVYAYLAVNAVHEWRLPTTSFSLSTLHFLSATGTSVDQDSLRYEELGFGPRRVLRPLLSLLKSVGVIEPGQFMDNRHPSD